MKIREESRQDAIAFLKRYPRATIRLASTLFEGYVVPIAPIPNISGPELMCNPANVDELRGLIAAAPEVDNAEGQQA